MRIGIDGRSLQDRPWGGVGLYTYGLLRALFEVDRENEYVVWYNAFDIRRQGLPDRGRGGLASPYPTFSEYPNVRVYRTRWPNKLLNLLMRFAPNVTCYMLHVTCDLFFMPNLNFIALPSHTKLILTVHDLSFEHFPEHFSWKSRLWHRTVGPRALLSRADQVIAVSEHTKGDLVETYGIAAEKVRVVYPGITPFRHSERSEESRGSSDGILRHFVPQNDGGGEYVLYFGALEPRKNIEGLIAGFELLNSGRPCLRRDGGKASKYRLMIAGLSTPYAARLKRRISKSPLRERITIIENPTEEEKWELYSGARLFVYPSFYEGFGFPPLEAMAAGVPVVASSASSVPEVCSDAAVLVSPWKVDEIADGMRVLLEDEEMRRRYIEAGRRRVAEFSWEKCAKQILDIFY